MSPLVAAVLIYVIGCAVAGLALGLALTRWAEGSRK